MTLLEKMSRTDIYSASEQAILAWLLQHPGQDLTIAQLAAATYTSNATIIRLCRKLGFQGYRQFKNEYIREMEARKYLIEDVNYNEPFDSVESLNTIIQKLGNLYKESIDLCIQHINGADIQKISRLFIQARRIYIYAVGDTLATAKAFGNRMIILDRYVIFPYDTGDDFANSYNITQDDLVVFMSYSFKSSRFMDSFDVIRGRTPHIVTFTANEEHLITKHSEYKIIIAPKESLYKVSTFYSQLVFEFILNLIYSMIFRENYSENLVRRGKIDELTKR